jgi:hypothetical protein
MLLEPFGCDLFSALLWKSINKDGLERPGWTPQRNHLFQFGWRKRGL